MLAARTRMMKIPAAHTYRTHAHGGIDPAQNEPLMTSSSRQRTQDHLPGAAAAPPGRAAAASPPPDAGALRRRQAASTPPPADLPRRAYASRPGRAMRRCSGRPSLPSCSPTRSPASPAHRNPAGRSAWTRQTATRQTGTWQGHAGAPGPGPGSRGDLRPEPHTDDVTERHRLTRHLPLILDRLQHLVNLLRHPDAAVALPDSRLLLGHGCLTSADHGTHRCN